MPDFIEPCHPRAGDLPVDGGWVHEIKLDGYRVQAHVARKKGRLFTRRGHDWSHRFKTIAQELTQLPASTAILDGEVIAPDAQGIPNFHVLRSVINKGRGDQLVYYAFDILYLDGMDLRNASLKDRREALRKLIGKGTPSVRFSENIHPEGSTLFEFACRMKLEGIVSKRADSPYRSGEQDFWRKVKCKESETFPIVASVEKLGAKPRRIASLYVGRIVDGRLLYAGKVGTGYEIEDLYELRERLNPYITPKSPLAVPVKKPKATWVQPKVLAEVEFGSVTADGLLREAVYKGVRDDLDSPWPALALIFEVKLNSVRALGSHAASYRSSAHRWYPFDRKLRLGAETWRILLLLDCLQQM
jgi:bifunctional non-homologous end joining protein LigD